MERQQGPVERVTGPLLHPDVDFSHDPQVNDPDSFLRFQPNAAYEDYMRMHKVFVGKATISQLVDIARSLEHEDMPRYLSVAGWAAAEAALIGTDQSAAHRMRLLDKSQESWTRALRTQQMINYGNRNHLIEHTAPYRMGLDLAVLPLLRGVVAGNVTDGICTQAFQDCLNIAQANVIQLKLAATQGDVEAVGDHVGFGYECNALLSLNRLQSKTWFAIPAMARADTGYHHSEQTHDLLVIRQKWGNIRSMIPVEIKSVASNRDRNRYRALLVRGKMHLSPEGHYDPRTTLTAIAAVHEGVATRQETEIVERVSGRFMNMLSDYHAGEQLGHLAAMRTVALFRDNSLVIERHPGLRPSVA